MLRLPAGDVPRDRPLARVLHMAFSVPGDLRRRPADPESTTDDRPGSHRTDSDEYDVPAEQHRHRKSRNLDFEQFYRAQYPSVVRLAYSLTGSMQVAEELGQEAFVSAHDRWCRIADFDRPDLWVRRVVINRSISFRRREASERRAVARLRVDDEPAAEAVVGDEVVWRALRELSPRQAEVLALFYVEDQPLSEVAEILGLGTETIKTHLKRGRAALATKLEELGHVR